MQSNCDEAALSNYRVLDISESVAGSYCSKLLADYGADVTKVEHPDGGDPCRALGPFLKDEPGQERSLFFAYLNNNKKSITLDVRSPSGAELLRKLLKEYDVLIESLVPDEKAKLGLTYEELKSDNSGLVVASVTPFGQTGPYRNFKGSTIIYCALSGVSYNMGTPGMAPLQTTGYVPEYMAGATAATAVLTSLYFREKTGQGQHVDLSIQEAVYSAASFTTTQLSYLGRHYVRTGNVPNPGGGYVAICKDGFIGVNFLTPTHWELFCSLIEMPELAKDPRFDTFLKRMDNAKELSKIIAPWFAARGKIEVFDLSQEWRLPFALVPTVKDIMELEQNKAREFFTTVEHPVLGSITMPGAPFKMSETEWKIRSPAPLLGQHNLEVYGKLGYSVEEISRLREMGVI